MATRRYYTLAIYRDGQWAPEFGDYHRETVVDEKLYYWDIGEVCKVISSADDQASINAKIAELNGETA